MHSEIEFVTMTNRSRFKHITSLKRNYKLHQRALTLSSFNRTPYFKTTVINKHIHDKMLPRMAADMNSEKVLKLSKLNSLHLKN